MLMLDDKGPSTPEHGACVISFRHNSTTAGHAPASPVHMDWQDKARTVAGFPATVTELPLL
jgi:hypothetical protein